MSSQPASSTPPEVSATPWILGPVRDGAFFLLPLLAGLVVVLALAGYAESPGVSRAITEGFFVLGLAHTLTTFRAFGSPRSISCCRRALVGVSCLIMAASVVVCLAEWYLMQRQLLPYVGFSLAALYVVGAINQTGQNMVLIDAYRARAGLEDPVEGVVDRGIVYTSAFFLFVIGWQYLDGSAFLPQLRGPWVPFVLVGIGLFVFVAAVVSAKRRLGTAWRRGWGAGPYLLMLGTALVYPLPLFLTLWKPEPSFNGVAVAYFATTAHLLQYGALQATWMRREGSPTGRVAGVFVACVVGGLALWGLMKGAEAVYTKAPLLLHGMQGVLCGLLLVHAYLDSRVYFRRVP
jgi:hypothetical protein